MKKKWIFIAIGFIVAILLLLPFFYSIIPLKSHLLKKIGAKFDVEVSAERVHLSWFGPQVFRNIAIKSQNLEGSVAEFRAFVPFWSLKHMGRRFDLEGGSFQTLTPRAELTDVSVFFDAPQIRANGKAKEGNQNGQFSVSGNAASEITDFTFTATQIPTLFADHLIGAKGMLAAAVGARFDCDGSGKFDRNEKGSFDCELRGTSSQGSISAAFTHESVTLRKPLKFSFQLTPELSRSLLKDANPLFLSAIASKTPISLQIWDRAFAFKRPFSLASLRIAHGQLDLGQVQIQNGPTLAALIKLLKNDRVANLKTMNAWFAPLDFSLLHGTMKADRMDFLLADSIHLATWGSIDLISGQLATTIGIPGDLLRSTFGIQNLPSNYMLTIPIQGTLAAPEVSTSAASAKIAALLASQTIPKKAGPIGKAFTLIAPPVTDESKDVPAAKRPFPWEK